MNRRNFLHSVSRSGLAMAAVPPSAFDLARTGRAVRVETARAPQPAPPVPARIRFGVVGLNHGHIYGLVDTLAAHGGELVSVYAKEADLLEAFTKRYPKAVVARSGQEVLEDSRIQVIATAAIPNERGPLAVRAMRHGKDVLLDKPAVTSLAQLEEVKRVQAETRRIFAIMFGRLESPATHRAMELVKAGAIGRVLQTIGTGPHKVGASRPDWFWKLAQYGGILTDIGTHQTDYFLTATGATSAEIVTAQVGNLNHPQYPEFQDFGDAMLRSASGTGYFRLDWFTPAGVPTFGDSRIIILGTDGYIEVRPTMDLGGRDGGNHLFLADAKGTHYIDTRDVVLPFGARFVDDVVNRTDTANPQARTFLAMQLALEAQAGATPLTR